jgi:hypothetical protein
MTRNHIIGGLDDSPSGQAAPRWVTQQLLAGSVLRAIHVLDRPYSSARPGVDITPATMDEIESAYRTNITNVFQDIDPCPDWSTEFRRGEPGPVLVRGVQRCATTGHRNSGACRTRPTAGWTLTLMTHSDAGSN